MRILFVKIVITCTVIIFCFKQDAVAKSFVCNKDKYNICECDPASVLLNNEYGLRADSIYAYYGPDKKYGRIVNEKASKMLGSTEYITFDTSTKIVEKCRFRDYSYVIIANSEELVSSHKGWIKRGKNLVTLSKKNLEEDCRTWTKAKDKNVRIVEGFLYVREGKDRWKDRIIIGDLDKDFIRCDYDSIDRKRIEALRIVKGQIQQTWK